MSARLSPDGMYYWDGHEWRPVVSNATVATAAARSATGWTRPLQYAVVAWYGVQALWVASLPFWYIKVMTQYADAMNRQSQESNPGAPTPPPELLSNLDMMARVSFYTGIVVALAITVGLIVAALKRWTWGYYAILVALILEVLWLAFGTVSTLAFSALAGQYVGPPTWMVVIQVGAVVPSLVLLVWMFVALVKRGPWAMKRSVPQVT